MEVDGLPTPEQQAQIEEAIATSSFLIVFVEPGNTAWVASCNDPAPWETADYVSH